MSILLLSIVAINLIGAALCALGIAREIQKPRSYFDDERADQA